MSTTSRVKRCIATPPASLQCLQGPARRACEEAWGSRRGTRDGLRAGQGVDSGVCEVMCPPCTPEPCSAAVATSCSAPLITAHNPALASACRAAQDGTTGLIAASENGHVQTIELLLDRHANINATGGKVICARHLRGRAGRSSSPPALAGIRCVVCVCGPCYWMYC